MNQRMPGAQGSLSGFTTYVVPHQPIAADVTLGINVRVVGFNHLYGCETADDT